MAPSFLDRFDTTQIAEDNIRSLFLSSGLFCLEYGQNVLIDRDSLQRAHLKRLLIKDFEFVAYASGFLMKFSPDLVVYSNIFNVEPFFMDIKASRTPIIFESKVKEVQESAELQGIPIPKRHEIGIIEREAYDTYTTFFPHQSVAVCYSAPYTPDLILCDWVDRLQVLFRYSQDRNNEAGGSGTPHVNIHLGMMRTIDEFFREEYGLELNSESLHLAKDRVKTWVLDKPPGTVTWSQFKHCLRRYSDPCVWLKGKFPDEQGGELSYIQAEAAGIGRRRR